MFFSQAFSRTAPVWKEPAWMQVCFIVDIVGGLSGILMELDERENIVKSYIYENSRIIAQRRGGQSADEYFYVKDRLGSVRQIMDCRGNGKINHIRKPGDFEYFVVLPL